VGGGKGGIGGRVSGRRLPGESGDGVLLYDLSQTLRSSLTTSRNDAVVETDGYAEAGMLCGIFVGMLCVIYAA
jgi:hypothetical protein